MPARAMAAACVGEAGDAGARHLELDDLALDGLRPSGDGSSSIAAGVEVAVEEVVQVLVGGDAAS